METFRGTDISEWDAVRSGETFGTTIGQVKDPITGKLTGGQKVDSTWTIPDRDYAASYASRSPNGVLIEFKPEARAKMQSVISDYGGGVAADNRLNGKGLGLSDVNRVLNSKGKVIYDATRTLPKKTTGLGKTAKGLISGIARGLAEAPKYEFLNPPSAGPSDPEDPVYQFERGLITQKEFNRLMGK